MPVYAEQKEHTAAYDRVVEPSLDAALRTAIKEESNLTTDSPSTPNTPSSTTSSSSSISQDETLNNKHDDSANPVVVEVSASGALSQSLEHHVFIFDWDDTLLASSFLASQGIRLDVDLDQRENAEFIRSELKQLENCVVTVLNEAMQRGHVNIITNAEHGWVELSAQKFLPAVVPFLSKVNVISARSTYEHLHPDSPFKWKYCAMHDRLIDLIQLEDSRKNIMSFGDSHVEREAVRAVTRGAPNTRTKSIKFAECPNTEQLRKQLELLVNCFHYIFTHEGDLDLMLKMSMVPAAPIPAKQSE